MHIRRSIFWGIGIYAVMGLAASFVRLHEPWFYGWERVFMLIVLGVVVAYATDALKVSTVYDVVPHALTWTFVAMFLDMLLVLPQSSVAVMYGDSDIWVGYILLATLPFVFTHYRVRYET